MLKVRLTTYNMNFNMNYFKKLFIACVALLSLSCNSQNCSDLQQDFTSYEQAKTSIKSTSFALSDKCNTSKSSWILGAEYYSCDNRNGYFFIMTSKKTYIHKDLPKELWYELETFASYPKDM